MYLEKHGESLTEDEKESRGFMSTYLCKLKNLKSINEAGFSRLIFKTIKINIQPLKIFK